MHSKTLFFVTLFGAVLLGGCGGSSDTTRSVTVDTVTTYHAENGTISTGPVDYFASISIELPGDATIYPATPDAARLHWTADGVPTGPYRVRLTYSTGQLVIVDVATGASALDFGMDRAGRATGDVVTQATPVTFAVSGLQPWNPAVDFLESMDWNARSIFWPRLTAAAGATSGTTAPFDWKGRKQVLPADTLWVTQSRDGPTSVAPSDTVSVVVAAQAVSGISMTDGVPLTVAVDRMAPPTGTGTVRLNWKQSQFLALLEPSGTNPGGYAMVRAQPAPLSVVGSNVALMGLDSKSTTDVNYGSLVYNRFLPATFQESVSTVIDTSVSRTLPGTTARFTWWPSVGRTDPIAAVPDPLVPLIGPSTRVTVNGLSASQPVSGVGLTPTIAWQAPVVGNATSYAIDLMEAWANADGVDSKPVVSWIQAGTSLTVPAGLMEAGKVYFVAIMAKSDPTGPGPTAPFRQGAESRGSADFISQAIQP